MPGYSSWDMHAGVRAHVRMGLTARARVQELQQQLEHRLGTVIRQHDLLIG